MIDPVFNFHRPLEDQLSELKSAIRAQPGRVALRIYYFQLLCVLGAWQKAIDQLQVCAQLDPTTAHMARAYREVILSEVFRSEVFHGRKQPHILGEPTPWIHLMTDALRQETNGQHQAAGLLRQEAFDLAPTTTGAINETPFSWIADADNRLGPICELYANGCYYWVSFETIRSIRFESPKDLRDMVWQPSEVVLNNGGVLTGFIPTRYPVQNDTEDALKLSQQTQWQPLENEFSSCVGQRLWTTDQTEHALLSVRSLELNTN